MNEIIIKKNCITCSNFNFLIGKCPSKLFPKDLNLHLKKGWNILAEYFCEEYDQIKITVYDDLIEIESSRLFMFDIMFDQFNLRSV